MEFVEIIAQAQDQLQVLTHLKVSNVIEATKKADEWYVTVELIERKAIPDTQDLLGVYEAVFDDRGSMISYHRRRVRRRSDTMEEAES